MNQKKAAIIVLLTLVFSTTFVVFNPTMGQANSSQKLKAQTLFSILSYDNTTIIQAFSNLDAQNLTVPQTAQTAYNEAVAHAEQAFSLMNQENFSEASVKAVEAMKKYEETLRILESEAPTEQTEAEVTAEEVIRLKSYINRAAEYAERLQNMTNLAKARGYNTAQVERKLSEVKQHLQNATSELRALNLDGATEELLSAKTLLEELKQLFGRLTHLVKTANIEKYLEDAEVRVYATKANITKSTNLTAAAKDDAIAALNNSAASLADARASIGQNNVDDAIEDLKDAKKWEEESKRALVAVNANANDASVTANSVAKADVMASR